MAIRRPNGRGARFVAGRMQSAAQSADTATGSVAGFTYGELAVLVDGDRPEPVRWLEEFLAPPFRVGARDAYAASVTLREDARRYAEALANQPAATAALDAFVNDTHMIQLPHWSSGPDRLTAFQQSFRVFYAVDRAARSVAILSPENNASARTALMRVVREIAMNRARSDGGVFLHAAAIAVGERGLLIAGEKGAGKTTVLLHLLRETGADYVANDRVLLVSPDGATARGMPTIVTVRPRSLAFVPGLQAALVARSFHYLRTLAEAAADARPPRPWADDSVGLSPAQVCALLGVERRAECIPCALLFPRITTESGGAHLRELTPGEAVARLRRALLSAGLAKHTSDLVAFRDDPPAGEEPVEEMLHAVAARVPCMECRLGAGTYGNGALAAECQRLLAV